MDEKSEFWRFIEPAAQRLGVEIFDIEAPRSRHGALKVYIYRPKFGKVDGQEGGVGISDCVRLSKQILEMEGIDRFISDDTTLEVSSPGINRKLKRREHFKEAVGERVRITYREENGAGGVALGLLTQVSDQSLTVEDEEKKQTLTFAFPQVSDARVDFLF